MRSLLTTLFVLLALGSACWAAEIQKGTLMNVKPNSIWFQEAAALTQWQRLKKSGHAKALASYQEKVLGAREAWQFLNQLNVKIISYDPATNQAHVEMRTPGRMLNTDWYLDAATLAP
jgi:hypothetical protein